MSDISTRLQNLAMLMINTIHQNRFANDSYVDTFIRIVGLSRLEELDPSNKTGDMTSRTADQEAQSFDLQENNLINGWLKSHDVNLITSRKASLVYLNEIRYLIAIWKNAVMTKKQRRIERLVGKNTDVTTGISEIDVFNVDINQYIDKSKGKLNLEDLVRAINERFQQIQSNQLNKKEVGELTLRVSLLKSIISQVSAVLLSIPLQTIGVMSGPISSAIKLSLAAVEKQYEQAEKERRALVQELTRLHQEADLILNGHKVSFNEKISLYNLIEALIYLYNLEYTCKNCARYQMTQTGNGQVQLCTFSSKKNLLTQPDWSCANKDTWDNVNNSYWAATDKVTEEVRNRLTKEP